MMHKRTSTAMGLPCSSLGADMMTEAVMVPRIAH